MKITADNFKLVYQCVEFQCLHEFVEGMFQVDDASSLEYSMSQSLAHMYHVGIAHSSS